MEGKPSGRPQLLAVTWAECCRWASLPATGSSTACGQEKPTCSSQRFRRRGADAKRASVRYPGRNINPAWSRDGEQLAYLSRRGSENFGQEARAIVIRSLVSGEERELLPRLAHMERVHGHLMEHRCWSAAVTEKVARDCTLLT